MRTQEEIDRELQAKADAGARTTTDRHRPDSGSAASRPMQERHANEVKPAYDGPRADSVRARDEMGNNAAEG